MGKALALCWLLLGCGMAAAQAPQATDLPGDPFFVKKTWPVGGTSTWGTMAIDPKGQRLYVAHAATVDVVDLDSGERVATIPGFRNARALALDDRGLYLYVADQVDKTVAVVARGSNSVASVIRLDCAASALAYEPMNRMLVAVCGVLPLDSASHPPSTVRNNPPNKLLDEIHNQALANNSRVMLIDAEANRVLAEIVLPGNPTSAAADDRGHVVVPSGAAISAWYEGKRLVTASFPPRLAVFDTGALAAKAHEVEGQGVGMWNPDTRAQKLDQSLLRFHSLDDSCNSPRGLAIDARHQRAFVACGGAVLGVYNVDSGARIAGLTVGPENEDVAYDPESETVYAANANATLSIIRQHGNTDSYAVVQVLPTAERARAVAVDPSTGDAYMVADAMGIVVPKPVPPYGIPGVLEAKPVEGSLQVLVIGH